MEGDDDDEEDDERIGWKELDLSKVSKNKISLSIISQILCFPLSLSLSPHSPFVNVE